MLRISKSAADVGVIVKDIEGQRRFYGDILGLPYMGDLPVPNGNLYVFRCGETLLKLYHMNPPPTVGSVPFGGQSGFAYITLSISDLEAAFERLEEKGVTKLAPPGIFEAERDLAPPIGRIRARYALIADADGNMVELFEYL
tara:strand:- start:136 stop:561 length:426 start_codon:yes stop_codon:yes gene_type:complete